MGLPAQVENVRVQLEKFPRPELVEIAKKLLVPKDIELCNMWATIQCHSYTTDDRWVYWYLERISDCRRLPRYHDLNNKDRKDLIRDVQSLSKELVKKLCVNNLDATLIHNKGVNFNGFFIYEDFGASNQIRIDESNANKLLVSSLIEKIASRAVDKIEIEPLPGKKGKNYEAIRFIRLMVQHNLRNYQMPLNKVVANLANALFDTSYLENDISNLINRQPLQS